MPDASLRKVKEINEALIYRKQDGASLAVSAPTEEMLKGGTETRLFITVVCVFAMFLSPAILLVSTCALGLANMDYVRAGLSVVALAILLWPIYVSTRYAQDDVVGRAMVHLRGTLAPILIGLVLLPSGAPREQQAVVLAGMLALMLALHLLRQSCVGKPPKDGKLRILLIGDSFPPKVDGVATFAENSALFLQEFGHKVQIVTSIAGPEKISGAPVTRLPGMTTPISPGHSISLPLPTVLFTFMRFKPHAIHLLEVSPLNLAVFVYAQLVNIPVTFSSHTRLDLYVNLVSPGAGQFFNSLILYSLERTLYPLCDAHMTVCTVLHTKVKARGVKDVRLWSSGAAKEFDKSKATPEYRAYLSGGHPELPLVLHVGRLGPEKNSDEIGPIMRETTLLMGGSDKVRFAIIGDGKSKEVIESEGLTNLVFAGFLRGEKLQTAYACGDVFFSPSTSEGFPLVFVEAMASGLSVVGPTAGGVYDPHDAKSAALAIKRAIDGGAEMRDAAYRHGKTFSWEKAVRELETLLIDVYERKRRADSVWF